MSTRTKFGEWWYWNGTISAFVFCMILSIIILLYIFAIPNYSRTEIQESTLKWEEGDGNSFFVITIGGDQWYTYDKWRYYNLIDGSEACDNTENCLNDVFEMYNTNKVNAYLKKKEDKEKEKNKKLEEENKNLKKNQSEL